MNVLVLVVVALLVVLALALGITGALGWMRRLPGNGVLGVRTPETRKDAAAWTVANHAAGPAFLGAGLVLGLGAAGLGLIGGWIGGLVVVAALLCSLALLNVAGLAGSRAAAVWKAAQDTEGEGCCGGSHDEGAGCSPAESGGAGCSPASGDGSAGGDPSADCGVSGGCGSCALQGMCESEPADAGR